MLSAWTLLSLVWLPSQRAVCLPCQLQVSLPCLLEPSLLSLAQPWLPPSSRPASLPLSFRRPVSALWRLGLRASPLQSSSWRPAGLLEASGSSSTQEQYQQLSHPDKFRSCMWLRILPSWSQYSSQRLGPLAP